jgi:hypothetical protein
MKITHQFCVANEKKIIIELLLLHAIDFSFYEAAFET